MNITRALKKVIWKYLANKKISLSVEKRETFSNYYCL